MPFTLGHENAGLGSRLWSGRGRLRARAAGRRLRDRPAGRCPACCAGATTNAAASRAQRRRHRQRRRDGTVSASVPGTAADSPLWDFLDVTQAAPRHPRRSHALPRDRAEDRQALAAWLDVRRGRRRRSGPHGDRDPARHHDRADHCRRCGGASTQPGGGPRRSSHGEGPTAEPRRRSARSSALRRAARMSFSTSSQSTRRCGSPPTLCRRAAG